MNSIFSFLRLPVYSILSEAEFFSSDIIKALSENGVKPGPCQCMGVLGAFFQPITVKGVKPNPDTQELEMLLVKFRTYADAQVPPVKWVELTPFSTGITSSGSKQTTHVLMNPFSNPGPADFMKVFFDATTLMYLAEYDSIANPSGLTPAHRKITLSRVTVEMDLSPKYRTLLAQPFPDPKSMVPVPLVVPDEQDAVAYDIGAACPPHWRPNPLNPPPPRSTVTITTIVCNGQTILIGHPHISRLSLKEPLSPGSPYPPDFNSKHSVRFKIK